MISPVTHILPLTRIRRTRLLPVRGRTIARTGQKINATDVIAECGEQSKHVLVDVRNSLRLNRKEPLENVMERRVNEKVMEGDIIAQKGGIFKRVVRAPVSGEIIHISSGRVMIEVPSDAFQLKAGYTGEVAEIIPEMGVVIESTGVLVQGAWGNGLLEQGMLLALAQSPDDILTRERLDVSMRSAVVLAGHCEQPDALKAGDDMPLRGLVLGSATADVIAAAEKVHYPVMVLEGVGRIPIDSVAFKVLTTNTERAVCLNAAAWKPLSGERPELFIPLPASAEIPLETDYFKAGQTVRIVLQPYGGQIGQIAKIMPGFTRFPSGLRAQAANIRLENGVHVTVPLSNLEVLE